MKVKIKKLHPDAVIPTKAHPTDAGFDLTATSRTILKRGGAVYGTGIAVEIPSGYVGLVFPRSSIERTDLSLSNAVGVIDSGYRGEIMAKFKPINRFGDTTDRDRRYEQHRVTSLTAVTESHIYHVGERIAQLIILPVPEIDFIEADELSDSDRGTGGYGSTGI